MAQSDLTVTISALGNSQPEADGLRLVGLRRFVRINRGAAGLPVDLDPMVMPLDDLLPYGQAALEVYVRECIVADAAHDADMVRAGLVAQAEQQAVALTVEVEVVP